MENDNTTPLIIAGQLPKTCYSDLNEFLADMVKVLRIPFDTYSVIQGAQGLPGKTGQAGQKGQKGDKGDGSVVNILKVPIPSGATYVDFPSFDKYQGAAYSIHHKGRIGSLVSDPPDFDPATDGIVSVGTIIGIAPSAVYIRVFFLFSGGITSVPDANHVLHISYPS